MGVPAVIWKGSNSAYCIPQSFEARVINPSASSNQIVFGPSSGNRITLNVAIPSANRTYTIPDTAANSSFVMTDASQTIDGFKTFVRNVSIQASTLIFRSAATTVSLTTATPSSTRLFTLPDQPSSDVLVADGTQTVTGTYTFNNTIAGSISGNAGTVTNGAYVNVANTFTLAQAFTATSNQLVLHSGVNQVTINSGTSAAARTYTIPDAGTTADFVMSAGSSTIAGARTFSSAVTINPASNQVVLSSGVSQLTLNSGTSAAARTYTVPDTGTTDTFAMLGGSQTFSALKTFSSGLAISGGSAANNTIWVASNVLNIRGGTSGTDIYNTSGNVVVDITDAGAVTLGASAGLGTSGNAYHITYGSTVSTNAANRGFYAAPGEMNIASNAYRDGASTLKAITTGGVAWFTMNPQTVGTNNAFEFLTNTTSQAANTTITGSATILSGTAAGAWALGPVNGAAAHIFYGTADFQSTATAGSYGRVRIRPASDDTEAAIAFKGKLTGEVNGWLIGHNTASAGAGVFGIYSTQANANVATSSSAGAWTWGATTGGALTHTAQSNGTTTFSLTSSATNTNVLSEINGKGTGRAYLIFKNNGTLKQEVSVDSSGILRIDDNVSTFLEMSAGGAFIFGTGTSLTHRFNTSTSTTASAGARTLPANPVDFWVVNINGTDRKIPYYAT